jgi:hypothetical protein
MVGHILKDIDGFKDIVASQSSAQSADFQRTLDMIAEKTAAIHEGINELREEMKQLRGLAMDFGEASRAVVASNEALAERMTGLQAVIDEDSDAIQTMRLMIDSMKTANAAVLSSMRISLDTLLTSAYDWPTLVVVLPKIRTKVVDRFDPRQLFQNQFDLFFMCSYTLQLSHKSFPVNDTQGWVSQPSWSPCPIHHNIMSYDSISYHRMLSISHLCIHVLSIDYPSLLSSFHKLKHVQVKKAAPVLKVGLVLLKIGLLSVGIPLPVAGLIEMLGPGADATTAYLDSAMAALDDDKASSAVDAASSQIDSATSSSAEAEKQIASIDRSAEGTRVAYEAIKSMPKGQGQANVIAQCGLTQKISSDGHSKWVLDDPSVISSFEATGGTQLMVSSANSGKSPRQVIAELRAQHSSASASSGAGGVRSGGGAPNAAGNGEDKGKGMFSVFSLLGLKK